MHTNLDQINGMGASRMSGSTAFEGIEGVTLADFWTWAFSDLAGERTLDTLSEFVVGLALENLERARSGSAMPMTYLGKRIEIRAAGWNGNLDEWSLNNIRFDISPEFAREKEGKETGSWRRQAECYVFCLYMQAGSNQGGPLNVGNWEFYVVERESLDERLGPKRRVKLMEVCRMTMPLCHEHLRDAVRSAVFVINEPGAEEEMEQAFPMPQAQKAY